MINRCCCCCEIATQTNLFTYDQSGSEFPLLFTSTTKSRVDTQMLRDITASGHALANADVPAASCLLSDPKENNRKSETKQRRVQFDADGMCPPVPLGRIDLPVLPHIYSGLALTCVRAMAGRLWVRRGFHGDESTGADCSDGGRKTTAEKSCRWGNQHA